ncbi:hypothetical protein SBA4_1420014 [Candidatus Sulfopaludibacter sp. SbA4]|nr:hypothetical protein SBA4_1420014 [Candidatus Sulfopaludibacter sp. SbA4]
MGQASAQCHILWDSAFIVGGPPGPRGSPWTRCLHNQISPMRSAKGRRGRSPEGTPADRGSAPQSSQHLASACQLLLSSPLLTFRVNGRILKAAPEGRDAKSLSVCLHLLHHPVCRRYFHRAAA